MTFLLFPIRFYSATVGLADVTSANIVGYKSEDLVDGKINMKGFTFSTVAGEPISLNDITGEGLVAGEDDTCADQVLVWNATKSGYTTYAYFDEGEDGKNWYDIGGESEPVIEAGHAFWYSSFKTDVAKKNFVVSGAVEGDNDVTITLVDGKINMVNNPYPSVINLNDPETVVYINCTAGEDDTCADQVLVWNATKSGYTTYAYFDEGEDGKNWYDIGGESEPDIPAGTAFWYSCFKVGAGADKALKFLSPIK